MNDKHKLPPLNAGFKRCGHNLIKEKNTHLPLINLRTPRNASETPCRTVETTETRSAKTNRPAVDLPVLPGPRFGIIVVKRD